MCFTIKVGCHRRTILVRHHHRMYLLDILSSQQVCQVTVCFNGNEYLHIRTIGVYQAINIGTAIKCILCVLYNLSASQALTLDYNNITLFETIHYQRTVTTGTVITETFTCLKAGFSGHDAKITCHVIWRNDRHTIPLNTIFQRLYHAGVTLDTIGGVVHIVFRHRCKVKRHIIIDTNTGNI